MKKIAVLLIASVIIIGTAEATKGGLPELWSAFSMLEQRVAALEHGGINNSLAQRVAALEGNVSALWQENSFLKQRQEKLEIETEIIQLELTGIRPLAIFPDDSVNCNAVAGISADGHGDGYGDIEDGGEVGTGVFVNDRSPHSKNLTRNYTRTTDVAVVSQFQNWSSVSSGKMSCVPTVAGAAIDYWNDTLPSVARNATSLSEIIDRLHRMMGTNVNTGTSDRRFLEGITAWINRAGYGKNMTITKRGGGIKNGTGTLNGVNVSGIAGTGDDWNPVSAGMIIDEFFTKKEFVILIMEVPEGAHAVAVHSMSNTTNSDGAYDVAVMDPAGGEIRETQIEPNGNICVEWGEDGKCKTVRPILQIWSISRIEQQ